MADKDFTASGRVAPFDGRSLAMGTRGTVGMAPECRAQHLHRARWMLKARRQVEAIMPKGLFRDSAWDVMLEVYVGLADGHNVYVKQAIIASDECPATAMRLITRLENAGLLMRSGDHSDHRRVVVSLTSEGEAAMEKIMEIMVPEPNGAAPNLLQGEPLMGNRR